MQKRKQKNKVAYRFYATLLDAWQNYLDTPLLYDKFYGFSENPKFTPEEFERKQYVDLIDKINRVPFTSEAASKGTAFNAVVDALISGEVDPNVAMSRVCDSEGNVTFAHAITDGFEFDFDIRLCREFASYFKGALSQQQVSAILHTGYGDVELYGYIDELMPLSVHDIKTTGNYSFGKFKRHWQHIVYPYCLKHNGSDIRNFEYNIVEFDKYGGHKTFTETYVYSPERDEPLLRQHCESLIEFLLDNLKHITDRKILGGENTPAYVGEPLILIES